MRTFRILLSFYCMCFFSLVVVVEDHFYFKEIRDFRVIDGDTVIGEIDGVRERIRLLYVDAPESKQIALDYMTEIGSFSTKTLRKLLKDKRVFVLYRSRDQYSRVLGELYVDESSVNLQLIRLGAAVLYKFVQFYNIAQRKKYMKAWQYARQKRAGIWSVNFENPYFYRKQEKLLQKMKHKTQVSRSKVP